MGYAHKEWIIWTLAILSAVLLLVANGAVLMTLYTSNIAVRLGVETMRRMQDRELQQSEHPVLPGGDGRR